MKRYLMLVVLTMLMVLHVEASFVNGGRMQSKNLNISTGGTLDNNGELIGHESATIRCDAITGKGLIRSPQITLQAKQFAYTGTIDCSGKCTITTGEAINQRMFKRTGGGEFIFLVDNNLALDASDFSFEVSDELEWIQD